MKAEYDPPPSPHPPRRGRPRSPSIDQAILEVALRQMATKGFSRMTMESVASEAGVDKPTLYRRYSGKEDLATAALARLQAESPPDRTGSPRDDLIAALRHFQRGLLRPKGMAMIGTLLAEEAHTPGLMRMFRRRIVQPRRSMIRGILDEARERGLVHPDADIDATVNLLIGSFYARYLTGKRIGPDWTARIVDTVWGGISARR